MHFVRDLPCDGIAEGMRLGVMASDVSLIDETSLLLIIVTSIAALVIGTLLVAVWFGNRNLKPPP